MLGHCRRRLPNISYRPRLCICLGWQSKPTLEFTITPLTGPQPTQQTQHVHPMYILYISKSYVYILFWA